MFPSQSMVERLRIAATMCWAPALSEMSAVVSPPINEECGIRAGCRPSAV